MAANNRPKNRIDGQRRPRSANTCAGASVSSEAGEAARRATLEARAKSVMCVIGLLNTVAPACCYHIRPGWDKNANFLSRQFVIMHHAR